MKNSEYIYEKKYIFVDGVRIPLAFMDISSIKEDKAKKRSNKHDENKEMKSDGKSHEQSASEATEMLDNESEPTEMLFEATSILKENGEPSELNEGCDGGRNA